MLQLILNAAWSPLFFGAKAPRTALADIVALWSALLAYQLKARKVDGPAAGMLVPYLLWVSYATILNEEIVRRNS